MRPRRIDYHLEVTTNLSSGHWVLVAGSGTNATGMPPSLPIRMRLDQANASTERLAVSPSIWRDNAVKGGRVPVSCDYYE